MVTAKMAVLRLAGVHREQEEYAVGKSPRTAGYRRSSTSLNAPIPRRGTRDGDPGRKSVGVLCSQSPTFALGLLASPCLVVEA